MPIASRVSLREEALTSLREAIVQSHLAPGLLISEQTLADLLGISRTPIREALLQLGNEGLVEFVPNRGVRITCPRIDHLAEMYSLRAGIEGYCATLLARRTDRADVVASLKALLEGQRRIVDAGDPSSWVVANMDFHMALVEACGNSLMIESIRNVACHTMRIGHMITEVLRARMEQALVEHTRIVEAIRVGKPDLAFREIEAHLGVTRDHMRKTMNDRAERAAGGATRAVLMAR